MKIKHQSTFSRCCFQGIKWNSNFCSISYLRYRIEGGCTKCATVTTLFGRSTCGLLFWIPKTSTNTEICNKVIIYLRYILKIPAIKPLIAGTAKSAWIDFEGIVKYWLGRESSSQLRGVNNLVSCSAYLKVSENTYLIESWGGCTVKALPWPTILLSEQ